MTTTITIANRKGGVGKTTTAATLGHGLTVKHKSVFLVDADPQGHLSLALGIDPAPDLYDVLVKEASLEHACYYVREDLWIVRGNSRTASAQAMLVHDQADDNALADAVLKQVQPAYVIIDTAPATSRLQDMALWMADLVIIPSATDFLSSAGIADLVEHLHWLTDERGWKGKILGILPTFYDEITKESKINLAELQEAFGDLVLSPIHRATVLRECSAEGRTIFEVDRTSRAADEYAALVWRVLDATR